ncbi:MAG: hypothetical protein H6981_01300 [Gammaproteobacteria bacterium]|nr:hypothetical protein [Gammaproteobacteria bacterium]MCP5135422.1 hypothetical protein [Gammaproteobacteria bacterium]
MTFTIDTTAFKADLRNLGIGLLLAGLIGLILDEAPTPTALYSMFIGAVVWLSGLSSVHKEDQRP